MKGCLIILGVVVLIVILVAYLCRGSEVAKEMRNGKNKLIDSCGPLKNLQNVRIANGPVLCVKCPGETEYRQIKVLNRTTRIGSGKSCEVVLTDEFVEPVHAIIKKEVRNNRAYYEFINMSKYNPIQWFNQKNNDYENVGYRKGVVLDLQEIFYVGESKVMVKCPVANHIPSKTERLVMTRNEAHEADRNTECVMMTETATKNVENVREEKAEPTRVYDFKTC